VLTPQQLQLLRTAHRVLDGQYAVLKAHEASEEMARAEAELREALDSEWFYEHLDVVLSRLVGKRCDTPDLSEEGDTCRACQATVAQMESEIAAVDSLKSQAIRELQELASPEKKIVRVRVASILGHVIEKPDNPDDSEAFETRLTGRIDELREYLLKLLAEGARIILE
jgi:hypothetical protein